jgi:hypothetical protein
MPCSVESWNAKRNEYARALFCVDRRPYTRRALGMVEFVQPQFIKLRMDPGLLEEQPEL